MPERIAKVDQEYAQRQVKVGETFHVNPEDVLLLCALGRIEPEEGELGYESRDLHPGDYATRDMTRQKRAYHRKSH